MTDLAVRPVASADLLAFCKATADALRLDILRALRDESFGVLELCRIFEMPQPGMSHHLKVLSSGGLVEARREGNSIFYRRAIIAAGHPLALLFDSLFDAVDRIPLDNLVGNRILEVHQDRAERSRQFFARHADELKENQELIVRLDQYEANIQDLLAHEALPSTAAVLEVGPGASTLINLLAKRFASVVAVDNSAEMLAKAKAMLDPSCSGKTRFVEAEPEHLLAQGLKVDLIVLNMVLHHLPSPARLFRTAASLLNPGGRLLIIDLRPHDQDWAREICGDLWLGFDPADLDEWATEAALDKGQSVYTGLKNGFQVQLRIFHNN